MYTHFLLWKSLGIVFEQSPDDFSEQKLVGRHFRPLVFYVHEPKLWHLAWSIERNLVSHSLSVTWEKQILRKQKNKINFIVFI